MTKEEIQEIVFEAIEQLQSKSMLAGGVKKNWWNFMGMTIIILQFLAITYLLVLGTP